MVDYREILRLDNLGYTKKDIASSVHSSRNTVSEVLTLAGNLHVCWPLDDDVTNQSLEKLFYPGRNKDNEERLMPDYPKIHRELAKKGVTLTLLWTEYCLEASAAGKKPYMSTQFNDNYRKWARITKATMRIQHKPGDEMEVDWAGGTIDIYDEITGEISPAYLFVAVLPCSLYVYAELCPNMKSDTFINCHIHAYTYFGGSTRLLIPDNLKAGVTKNTRYDTLIPRAYKEMADHYNTAIVPARVKHPDDYRRKNVIGNLSLKKSNNCIFRLNRCFSLPIIIYSRPQKWRRYSSLPFHFFSGYDTTLPSESFAGNAS